MVAGQPMRYQLGKSWPRIGKMAEDKAFAALGHTTGYIIKKYFQQHHTKFVDNGILHKSKNKNAVFSKHDLAKHINVTG